MRAEARRCAATRLWRSDNATPKSPIGWRRDDERSRCRCALREKGATGRDDGLVRHVRRFEMQGTGGLLS